MAFGIYKIKNIITGQIYIGCTGESFKQRWQSHKSRLRNGSHYNHRLQSDWTEYGEIQFTFSVLEEVKDRQEVFVHEQKWLNKLLASNTKMYNIVGVSIMFPEASGKRQLPSASAKLYAEKPRKRSARKEVVLDGCALEAYDRLRESFPFISNSHLIRSALIAASRLDMSEFRQACMEATLKLGKPVRGEKQNA